MNCINCGSEIKLGKQECSVCFQRNFQEKIVSISIQNYHYAVISDALELAIENCEDFDKRKEYKEVYQNWNNLSENFN